MGATRNTAYFVEAIRQLSNTEGDPIATDSEVADRASEAKAALYDLILGTYEHYAVTTFAFSLAGGVGANSVPLPTDFYKDVSLDRNPSSCPQTIHRLSSWVERNAAGRRVYTLLGSQLVVEPPTMAQGNYLLRYTPLDMPFAAPVVVAPDAGDAVDISLGYGSWAFTNGAFDQTFVGAAMTIAGASQPGNNGTFIITAVDSATSVRTAVTGLADELLGVGVTCSIQPAGTVDLLPQIMAPWYEYIQVAAAIAVKDKIEQDTADLEARLQRLTARITSMAANRMEEGGQIAMPGRRDGFWDDGAGTPWG